MVNIPLPRLLDQSGNYLRSFRPLKVSVDQSIIPLSTASMELPEDESLPARNFVEVFTSMGSAGIFRIRSPQNAYGEDTSVCELEHAIVETGDYLVREKISEMMTPKAAMQRIFSHYRGSRWRLGNVDALGTSQIAVQINYENVLTAMISVFEQVPSCYMTFDFTTFPWTVRAAAKGSSVGAEGRLSRNVESARIIYDDSELCTRAYYEVETTDASGEPSSEWRSLDADTINTYGVVEREVPIGAGYTAQEALFAAQEYLRKHKKPRVSVEISGQDLSQITGESLDTFTIGKLFRLSLVDYDLTIEDVITGLSWSDVYGHPTEVTVNLADEEDTAVAYIHDIESSGGRSGGGGGGKKQQNDTWKEYYTEIQKTDHYVDIYARHVDRNNNILEQAGMYLDSNGVLQYAEDAVNNIGSKFKVQADYISAVVDTTDGSIKAAEIWLGIDTNLKQSHAKISADIIDIDGIVTALKAKTVGIGILEVEGAAEFKNTIYGEATITAEEAIRSNTGFNVGGVAMNIADITFNTAKTQMTVSYTDGREPVTFNKAVSLSGEWSGNVSAGKSYKVTPSAGNVHYSPQIDSIYRYGDVTWDSDYKGFSTKLRTQDANGTDLIEEEITFDTTRSFNAGKNSVTTIAPTSIRVSASQTGTMVGTLSGASSGKYVAFNVGNTQYCILLT